MHTRRSQQHSLCFRFPPFFPAGQRYLFPYAEIHYSAPNITIKQTCKQRKKNFNTISLKVNLQTTFWLLLQASVQNNLIQCFWGCDKLKQIYLEWVTCTLYIIIVRLLFHIDKKPIGFERLIYNFFINIAKLIIVIQCLKGTSLIYRHILHLIDPTYKLSYLSCFI